jgi:uncharacterized protein (DUF1810 family)
MGWGLAPWRGATESKAPTKHARISLIPPLVPGCWRAEAVVANAGSNAAEIFGSPDDLKLRSSATLFASVSAPDSVFHRLLEKFYPGGPDKETLRLLGISKLS